MDVPKPSSTLTHRMALVVLCLTAGLHLVVMAKGPGVEAPPDVGNMVFVGCLWVLVIWKVWRRSWGRGVGVVMLLIGGSLLHFWWDGWGMCRGTGDGERDFVDALKCLQLEIALVVTGFFCLLLPGIPSESETGDEDEAVG